MADCIAWGTESDGSGLYRGGVYRWLRRPEVAGVGEKDEGTAGFLRCFGMQLRVLRERAGLTRAELGKRLGYSEDLVASVELGRRIAKPELIDAADAVLGGDGLLTAMKEEVARARYPAFFRDAAQVGARGARALRVCGSFGAGPAADRGVRAGGLSAAAPAAG